MNVGPESLSIPAQLRSAPPEAANRVSQLEIREWLVDRLDPFSLRYSLGDLNHLLGTDRALGACFGEVFLQVATEAEQHIFSRLFSVCRTCLVLDDAIRDGHCGGPGEEAAVALKSRAISLLEELLSELLDFETVDNILVKAEQQTKQAYSATERGEPPGIGLVVGRCSYWMIPFEILAQLTPAGVDAVKTRIRGETLLHALQIADDFADYYADRRLSFSSNLLAKLLKDEGGTYAHDGLRLASEKILKLLHPHEKHPPQACRYHNLTTRIVEMTKNAAEMSRKQIAPKDCLSAEWLHVMATRHSLENEAV